MQAQPANPISPPHVTVYSTPGKRSPEELLAVIAQFDVAHAERYRPRILYTPGKVDTFCNFFATDVAVAMRVVLPHWVDAHGDPAPVAKGRELNVGGMVEWLKAHGIPRFGWRSCTEVEAREAAARGEFAIATWLGEHVAVVIPSPAGMKVTTIAQAGRSCFPSGSLMAGFGSHAPECVFWCHP